MKVLIIGGTGHIGKNLVKMLVDEGLEVIVMSRGIKPVDESPQVRFIRKEYDRDNRGWQDLFSAVKPDVIIDILGTHATAIYETGKLYCKQFILCGSIWMFGEPKIVPTPEITQSECIFPGYAKRYAEMQNLKERAKQDGIRFTAIMPPNICGPGKIPLDCYGSRSIENHKNHALGKPVPLPEPGQTLIGPCDAEDVARGFYLSVINPENAADEIFNVGSSYALTARQFVETYGKIYGVKIPIDWCSWKEYSEEINPQITAHYHFKAHMCPDISKISSRLGYKPAYTPEETMERALNWMRKQGLI
ncbi:MAG: NAD(P)-dependent oxidoreductase [Candidatus Omnitrophica bacterium]|nr:NAD(P)-dependent oxidoreductase [Candidatus Omnitrophota bacterium]